MNRPALDALTCVHGGDFARALSLLPQSSSAEEGWARATCLHALDQVDEAASELVQVLASGSFAPPARLLAALLATHAKDPVPFTVAWVAHVLRGGQKRAFLQAALPAGWSAQTHGPVAGALLGTLVMQGDVQGTEAMLTAPLMADDFSGPWLRGLSWVFAALGDPAALEEAVRQVIEEIPTSTSEQFETLLAVLIERNEHLGRPDAAGRLWGDLTQTVNDHPLDIAPLAPVGGHQLLEPDDYEIELMVLEGNTEIDVFVTLPTRRALDFLRRVSGDVTRPEHQRQTADQCLRRLCV